MTPALSLYLDILRFFAAFIVFISHYAENRLTGGLFWQLMGYGRLAVLVFFVLSGFVIAWISQGKESNIREYSVSRISRLYSVILPAFILTAILDSIGTTFNSTLYIYDTGADFSNSVTDYLLSAFFLGQSWTLKISPGSDLPFWSLNYEAWYYVIFACAVFFSGKKRLFLLVATALLTGPKILLLFPIWLMGVAAWHLKDWVSLRLGRILIVGAVASFAGLEMMGGQKLFLHADTPWLPHRFSVYDYMIGLIVATLICGIAKARLPMPGRRLTRATHALAGTTFGLYLFHYPFLSFFGTVLPGEAASFMHRVLLFVFALGASLVLAALTEQRKDTLKRFLRSVVYTKNAPARTTVMAPSPTASLPDRI